jgi:DNA-binding beta-propeller fold protein YncE
VRLTSTDPSVAPIDHAFTAQDKGVYTFTVTLNTVGTWAINLTDLNHGFGVGQGGIVVHPPLTSAVLPVVDHKGMVYDPALNMLYITTGHGTVERYDVANQTLLAPFQVGVSLLGADVTTDGKFLYVADGQRGATQGTFHKVDLTTGAVTELAYNRPEASFDVAIGPNGKALADEEFEGSGWVPLSQIDLSTDTLTTRTDAPGSGGGGSVRQNTLITRGPDRSLFFLTESNISSGPAFAYNATANTFSKAAGTGLFLDNLLSAVNRNGSLVAVEVGGAVSVLDANLNRVKELGGINGGVAFDPIQDVLYGVNATTAQIFAFDTTSWAVKWVAPVGQSVNPARAFGDGVMTVSSDGKYLFLGTSSGVRQYTLPQPTGVIASLQVSGFPAYVKADVAGTFTVTALDPAGNVVTGFRGTVRFASTDSSAFLPADYTFTAADAGSHTFTATLNTNGTNQAIAAFDLTDSINGTQSFITVHSDVTSLIPVVPHRDLVFDPTRNYLYITSSDGTVQRYDVANQTLLAPFQAGVSLLGADVTPDGKYLYVADNQRGATQGSFHAVNLSTGAVTDLSYTLTSASWDVSLGAGGKGFADEQFEGSGWVPLYQVDTAANTLTKVTNDPGSGGSGQVRQNSMIRRSADRSLFLFTESNISSGPLFTYDATAGTWSPSVGTGVFLDNVPAAVNRNGTLIAIQLSNNSVTVLNKTLNLASPVKTLTGVTGALLFDPTRDLLYVANGSTVTAYDTNTWAVQFSLPVGESIGSPSVFGNGVMAVSADDRYLFVATASGVRVIGLPVSNQLVVTGFPGSTTAGVSGSITVTAEDAGGHVLTGYTGTVHFSSTDGQAVLPADYTFGAGDNGAHTFTNGVTLKTAGTQSISVRDNGSPALTGGANVTVTAAAATSLTLSGLPPTFPSGAVTSVVVTARDAYGNAASGYRGTAHFSSTDGQASLPADYTFTSGDGGAHTFTNGVSMKTLGAQSVTVGDGTFQNSANTTVVAGAATQLVVTVQPPGTVTPGVAFGLTVSAEDANGNVDTSFTGNVALALASNPGGATLGGTTSMNAANGVAAFTGLTLDKTGTGYTIQATGSGLTPATTNPFNVVSLSLSNNTVLEFRPVGTRVGTLSTAEAGSGHTFTYSLVSGAGSADNASFTISGNKLLTADAFDAAARPSYSVRVRSTDEANQVNEAPFTVTITDDPALSLSNGTLTVTGTAGNDAFSFAPGTPQDSMSLNGTALAVDAASVTAGVIFNGGGGSDSATLFAGTGANTLNLSPGGGTLSGPGYKVTLSAVAQVIAVGHAGDRAYLTGSAGNDVFVGTPSYAYLHGSGYFNQANGFGVALAVGAGGSDTAYLYDSPGNDAFVGTPAYSYLNGPGFFNQANGFSVVVGNATAGGTDTAYLYGSAAGGNVFVGTPSYSYLYGTGFFNQANGFQVVVGNGFGPGNLAYLYGSAAGGNVFVATPSYSYLYGTGFFNQAQGFLGVTGNAAGPNDVAYLYDTAGGTFVATSTYAYVSGSGLYAQANGFRSVYAYSGGGGSAYLYGTMTAADTFVQGGGYAYLYGDAFFELESGFAYVWANPYARR